MIVASCLEPEVAALTFDDEERQGAVLEWILCSFAPQIADVLGTVPDRIPLEVHLDIGSSVLSRRLDWTGLGYACRAGDVRTPARVT